MVVQKCTKIHWHRDDVILQDGVIFISDYASFSLCWTSFSIQELYSLMFSLDWVSIKAQIMGPAHLISDYVEYGHILDKEVSTQGKPTMFVHITTDYKYCVFKA